MVKDTHTSVHTCIHTYAHTHTYTHAHKKKRKKKPFKKHLVKATQILVRESEEADHWLGSAGAGELLSTKSQKR